MKRRCLDILALNALMKATHLLGLALGERLRQCRHSSDSALRRFARVEEQALHAALLDEALQILGSRWNKIPERQRPHYTPEARFRILRIRRLLALSAEDTARTFRISPGTVSRWEQETHGEPERETVGSLIKPAPPIRRFADVVRHVVQDLTLAGLPGDRSVALHLARAGWTLSRRTVQRIRREKPRRLPPATQAPPARAVRARFPNHVWMIDITEIPGFLRLFSFKLAVVFDAFSRAPLSARVFLREPSGRQTAQLLRHAVLDRNPPRHLVTDQGAQFTSQVFRRMVRTLAIRHRYGAIGRTGSIALIERFFGTLKTTACLRSRPALLRADLERRLGLVFAYYLWLRPHQSLGGATPGEIYLGQTRQRVAATPLPRGRPGEEVGLAPNLEVRYLDRERTLPHLVSRAA
jgi:transposase InsO family protein/DNA-binding transcriptional regulator YiaG